MTDNRFGLEAAAAARYDEFVAPLMQPFVSRLVDAAAVRPGERVLDVACGTGFVARQVAARVGPDVGIVGVDLNPAMVAVAQHQDTTRSAQWFTAPADALPLADSSVDVALCQQGLQFVPDLTVTLRELARVLAPGARLLATTWTDAGPNPYFDAQERAIGVHEPTAAAAMRTAVSLDRGRIEAACAAAGFRSTTISVVTEPVALPVLPQYAADHLSALPWGALLARHGPDALAVAADAITTDLAAYRAPDGGAVVPVTSLLVTAGI